ncbi:DUF397 domain-containing protein [Streptomyces sp. NPDC056831]|uniref:DUF397 domain-containing protein n=1 Tax=Streptomyces sp. NPDC056831 TaxID=3345954 RepID=UPI0036AE5CA5
MILCMSGFCLSNFGSKKRHWIAPIPAQGACPGPRESPGRCETHVAWRASSYSGGGSSGGDCVEVATLPTGAAVRDSKNPSGPALRFGDGTWAAFLAEAERAR